MPSRSIEVIALCVTGAEKAPDELFTMVNQLGHCRLWKDTASPNVPLSSLSI